MKAAYQSPLLGLFAELCGYLFACCFISDFMDHSFFRFSSKALSEWFSDTFQPQHSLADDSFWGMVSAFSGRSFPRPCLGYFSRCAQSFGGNCLCHRLASQAATPPHSSVSPTCHSPRGTTASPFSWVCNPDDVSTGQPEFSLGFSSFSSPYVPS